MDKEMRMRVQEKEVEDLLANLVGFNDLPAWLKTQIDTRREQLSALPTWNKRVIELYEEIIVLEKGLAECPARREIAAKRLAAAEASLNAVTEKETEDA